MPGFVDSKRRSIALSGADMLIHSTLLLLLVTPQDTPKADTAADRARRAAIVDRIMAEPPPPRAVRAAPVEDPLHRRLHQLSW